MEDLEALITALVRNVEAVVRAQALVNPKASSGQDGTGKSAKVGDPASGGIAARLSSGLSTMAALAGSVAGSSRSQYGRKLAFVLEALAANMALLLEHTQLLKDVATTSSSLSFLRAAELGLSGRTQETFDKLALLEASLKASLHTQDVSAQAKAASPALPPSDGSFSSLHASIQARHRASLEAVPYRLPSPSLGAPAATDGQTGPSPALSGSKRPMDAAPGPASSGFGFGGLWSGVSSSLSKATGKIRETLLPGGDSKDSASAAASLLPGGDETQRLFRPVVYSQADVVGLSEADKPGPGQAGVWRLAAGSRVLVSGGVPTGFSKPVASPRQSQTDSGGPPSNDVFDVSFLVGGGLLTLLQVSLYNQRLLAGKLAELEGYLTENDPSVLDHFSLRALHSEIKGLSRHLHILAELYPLAITIASSTESELAQHLPEEYTERLMNLVRIPPFWYQYWPSLARLAKSARIATASVAKAMETPHALLRPSVAMGAALYYAMHPKEAAAAQTAVAKDPHDDLPKAMFGVPDNPLVKQLSTVTLPSLKTNFLADFPILAGFSGEPGLADELVRAMTPVRVMSASGLGFTLPLLEGRWHEELTKNSELGPRPRGRPLDSGAAAAQAAHLANLPGRPAILHFHGGGFIAGSSGAHQVYLRDFVRLTGALVLSVDYRTAPEHKYPVPLYECYGVYRALVSGYFGFRPTGVVLLGDSAGGNLAVSVTLRALADGLPAPAGVCIFYPALELTKRPTVARLFSAQDPLIPSGYLQVCLRSYVPKGADSRQPTISPVYAPATALAAFPPTLIIGAGLCPLLDDYIVFTRLLLAAGRSVTTKVYPFLPHGFLSLIQVLEDIMPIVEESAAWVQDLLQ